MKRQILNKVLNNSCTEAEFEEVVQWIIADASSKESKKWGFDDWKSYQEGENPKVHNKYSPILDRIHHEINLRSKSGKPSKGFTFNKAISWITRVAAIIMLPILGILLFMISNRNLENERFVETVIDTVEIVAPIGSRTVVRLSDGTVVNLNYGSKIKYPRIFIGDTRELILEGEGYFEVAHNPQKPFVVKTGKLNIKALGTIFNVQGYSDNDVIETTLVEGKVVTEEVIEGGENRALGFLTPGQHVSYNKTTGKVVSTKGDIEKYISWKDGKLKFDNNPISQVVSKLSRMFNVDIEVADNIKDYTYTVTFNDESLYLILDLMAVTTPIEYVKFSRNKLQDGTYSKQKILIKKRN